MKKFATSFLLTALLPMLATAQEAKTPTKAVEPTKEVEAPKPQHIGDMLTMGSFDAKLRLGYEYSDFDNKPVDTANTAEGLSLSSYLGYRSAELGGVSFYVQGRNTTNFVEDFNDGIGGADGSYDVIADTEATNLHQAYLDLSLLPDTKIRLGRQEVLLDDVRFFGNIGWRNTFQTFDGVTLTNKTIADTTITLGLYNKVNTIFDTQVPFDHIGVINAKYTGIKDHTLAGFVYLVDADEDQVGNNKGAGSKDSATYGFRANGKFDALGYDLTVAQQSDYADTDGRDAQFVHAFGSYKLGNWTPGLGYMYLSDAGDDGKGFDTLFSTAHKFNGWSDQFLATNGGGLTDGLQDYYASIGGKFMGNKVVFAAHYFDAVEDGAEEYGYEYNALIARPLTKRLTASLKGAYYDGNDDGTKSQDETVVWFRLDYKIGGKVSEAGSTLASIFE